MQMLTLHHKQSSYNFHRSALVFRTVKCCEIRPKFSPIMHFLQESYKNRKLLQVCYNVEHFLQESDNIFAKFASIL